MSPLLANLCSTLPLQWEHLLAKLFNCKFPYCSIQLTSCFKWPPNVCVTQVIFFVHSGGILWRGIHQLLEFCFVPYREANYEC